MTNPGVLPSELHLEPIERISPSRFSAMLECPLRGALESGSDEGLLPASPAARVGTIAHKLLETALTSDPTDLTKTSLEALWDSLVAEAEEEMAGNWLERCYVPLRQHVWRYSVRRIRAVKRSLEIVSSRSHGADRPAAGAPAGSAEQWVASRDGTVGGFIDRIVASPQGHIIRDYKSGSAFEQGVRESAPVRAAYATQLKLYAALFQETHGEWPTRLELAPLRGDLVEVPFTREECSALLTEAMSLRETANEAIVTGNGYSLASPAPQTCMFCQYRPLCLPYRTARDHADDSSGWPLDVWGAVEEHADLERGQVALTLANPTARERAIAIGPLSGAARHPALTQLTIGAKLSVFNLRSTKVEGRYREGRSTIMYVETEAYQEALQGTLE